MWVVGEQNRIERLENLDFFKDLRFLALSHNNIKKVENIGHLSKLEFIDLSFNNITEAPEPGTRADSRTCIPTAIV